MVGVLCRSPEHKMADDAPVGEHTAAIEAWLATSAFEQAKDTAYTMARGGSGSFDRNISPEVLERVVVDLHQRLPAGLMVPAPDRDFIDTGARQHVARDSVLCHRQTGRVDQQSEPTQCISTGRDTQLIAIDLTRLCWPAQPWRRCCPTYPRWASLT